MWLTNVHCCSYVFYYLLLMRYIVATIDRLETRRRDGEPRYSLGLIVAVAWVRALQDINVQRTILAFTSSNGRSTKAITCFRHSLAFSLNAAPGSQLERYFTKAARALTQFTEQLRWKKLYILKNNAFYTHRQVGHPLGTCPGLQQQLLRQSLPRHDQCKDHESARHQCHKSQT
jgi:hypothetical protein